MAKGIKIILQDIERFMELMQKRIDVNPKSSSLTSNVFNVTYEARKV